jgi:hypothetical protein
VINKENKMKQLITNQVIQTFNNSGKSAAKKCFKLLVQIHDVDKKTSKELALSLNSYIN